MIKVHPQDCHLLSVKWDNSLYIDQTLPFGLQSAPKIFSAVANAIQWILQRNPPVIALPGWFYSCSKGLYSEAVSQKNTLTTAWEKLGVPMEVSKLEGASQTLKFLGIDVDVTKLQLRLPDDKFLQLKKELANLILEKNVFKK